jgi:hypothetical protein
MDHRRCTNTAVLKYVHGAVRAIYAVPPCRLQDNRFSHRNHVCNQNIAKSDDSVGIDAVVDGAATIRKGARVAVQSTARPEDFGGYIAAQKTL